MYMVGNVRVYGANNKWTCQDRHGNIESYKIRRLDSGLIELFYESFSLRYRIVLGTPDEEDRIKNILPKAIMHLALSRAIQTAWNYDEADVGSLVKENKKLVTEMQNDDPVLAARLII